MKMKLRHVPVLAVLVFLTFSMPFSAGCDRKITADPVIIQYSGPVSLLFNWTDGSTSCAACSQLFAKVKTDDFGDFDYGPFPVDMNGLLLDQVFGGSNRTIIVWMTDVSGKTIYRGVVDGLRVLVTSPNPPVQVDLYPLGWHTLGTAQPSVDWSLADVKMSGDGSGWIAGRDNTGTDGVVFKGGADLWALANTPATSSSNWALHSISPAPGGAAWAVGSDSTNLAGIILRSDGALWHDDVAEPNVGASWELFGVDFGSDGVGWAVGENNSGVLTGVVLKYDAGWSQFPGPSSLTDYGFFDVADLSGGDFLATGADYSTVPARGFIARWDDTGGSYIFHTIDVSAAPSCSAGKWWISDIYAVADDDWWAVGTCSLPSMGGMFGLAFHYDGVAGLVARETLPAISGDWSLEGVWADAAGGAWAVGGGVTTPVILRRDPISGNWSQTAPISEPSSDWMLWAVDFPPTGWGYAVGTDNVNGKGVLLRYGFPK